MKFIFSFRSFIYFSILFFLFAIIGTLSHEYGHILVAKSLGYQTKLHYGSMSYFDKNNNLNDKIFAIFKRNKEAIQNRKSFKEKSEFENLIEIQEKDSFLINLGGPIQTILTGTFGFILLYKRNNINFNKTDWILVFLSLFWLREVFNPVFAVMKGLINKQQIHFIRGDEPKISEYLNFHYATFDLLLGTIGIIIFFIVVFKFIPLKNRITFLLSGLIGGSLGFYFWMYKIGPIILP